MRYHLTRKFLKNNKVSWKKAVSWDLTIAFEQEDLSATKYQHYFESFCVKEFVKRITASERQLRDFFNEKQKGLWANKMKKFQKLKQTLDVWQVFLGDTQYLSPCIMEIKEQRN